MSKITIGGETFDYDGTRQPVSEALWIEKIYKRRYVEWQSDLVAGDVKAFIMLACLVWRRDGRDVTTAFEDILEGRKDFDLNEMLTSMREAESEDAGTEPAGADPTTPGEP